MAVLFPALAHQHTCWPPAQWSLVLGRQWADPTSQRDVPPGLTKRDEKALRKIRKRAHYLDKGMNLCGFRVGWTFWIGTCFCAVPKASSSH